MLISPAPPLSAVSAQAIALFLDIDGTLAPIVLDPAAVVPSPRRTSILVGLSHRLAGRVAVVSGRTLDEVDRILDGAVQAAAGQHGLERRTHDGLRFCVPPDPALATAKVALLGAVQPFDGAWVEDKGASLTLHFRARPELAVPLAEALIKLAAPLALEVHPGDMVMELRTPGADKGQAVRRFMAAPPFRGACPIFVGDDFADEAGFKAALELGGFGVLVGRPRPSAAVFRLADVDAVLNWLEAFAIRLSAREPDSA